MADVTRNSAPSTEALRDMMAMAAATAAAAAGDASTAALAAPAAPPRYVRQHTSRAAHNRRQSISHLAPLIAAEPLPKGAPLPPTSDGSRWRRIAAVAAEIASKWQHPPESNQYETDTLHHVRAILYMNKALITQSFVSHVSGVSQGSLSHYVRGLFRGNQKNVEDRLSLFVRKFAAGDLDPFLEEARAGSRPLSRALVLDATATTAAPSTAPTPQSVMLPPTDPSMIRDARPPVPPPPPPQLQPAPWARQPPAAKPPPVPPPIQPTVSPASSAPDVSPPRLPPAVVASASLDPSLLPKPADASPVMTERARRARQRRIAQARAKRGRTPFTTNLENMAEPTPMVAVERAYHALVAPNWTTDSTHVEPLLLPIQLFVQHNEHTLHMYTQWDVNERTLSPEIVAERIRRARGLPKEIAAPAAFQIRRALFEAGIICPPPPNAKDTENPRLIRIEVELTDIDRYQVLRDEFEWDLGMGAVNSPELFAQCLCIDANIPQKHAAVVARAIRHKLSCAHAIAYGDAETRSLALKCLAPDDPLRKGLQPSFLTQEKTPEEIRARRLNLEKEIAEAFVYPLCNSIVEESQKQKAAEIAKKKEEETKKEFDRIRAAEEVEETKRQEQLEDALKAVNEAAVALQAERGLDFRPYLALKMARNERPGVWTPGVFDRKRRRQTSFPMIQPSRISTTLIHAGPRLPRRRRSTRRSEGDSHEKGREEDGSRRTPSVRKQVKREREASAVEAKSEVMETLLDGSEQKIRLVLRVKAPPEVETKPSGSSKKRRRR